MNTKRTTAVVGTAAILMMIALAYGYPAFAQTTNTPATSTGQAAPTTAHHSGFLTRLRAVVANFLWHHRGTQNVTQLVTGQTLTFSSAQGAYRVIGNANQTGNATGTLALTVTSVYKAGYTYSITGNITLGNQTYQVTSGVAQSGPLYRVVTGQATTSGGGFILVVRLHGNATNATIWADLKNGTSEYGVHLLAQVQ